MDQRCGTARGGVSRAFQHQRYRTLAQDRSVLRTIETPQLAVAASVFGEMAQAVMAG
ncbi:Uncharacterised protein [Mycobacteroides abscessus subsp. abscessus]|nr:Uncharacterised protein [Mycobacteroides abscessus subsp. abscessus]